MDILIYLIPLFFITALLYSMAGFGGGSTYLALLALFSFPYMMMPKVALLCNIIVAGGGAYYFIKAGHFSPRKVYPFILGSVPIAYFAGTIHVNETIFLVLLCLSLAIAGSRMLLSDKSFRVTTEPNRKKTWAIGLPVGIGLGALSGIVGIGGGIFLAPCLYFLGWAQAKEVAAASSVFILVNSIAGLLGQLHKETFSVELAFMLPLAITVLLGGQIGSRIGADKLPKIILQRITAVLILSVSFRILWRLL
jgi:uncharacterized protein